MNEILFFVFGGVALTGGLGVVLARNPVHSALFLVQTLVAVAALFLLQDAQLLAVVQIIVYAGAIVVLFLFVIMLLGVDKREALTETVPFQRPAALAIGAIVLAELVFLAGHEWVTGAKVGGDYALQGGGRGNNVQRVASVLFTDFLWPFQITAALLVIAVVGAVVLAKRSGERAEDPQGEEVP